MTRHRMLAPAVPAFVDVALHVTLVFEPREWRFGWNGRAAAPRAGVALMLGPVNLGLTYGTAEA